MCGQVIAGQFARVVKGVDLRSTGGNSAWVRSPQLTIAYVYSCAPPPTIAASIRCYWRFICFTWVALAFTWKGRVVVYALPEQYCFCSWKVGVDIYALTAAYYFFQNPLPLGVLCVLAPPPKSEKGKSCSLQGCHVATIRCFAGLACLFFFAVLELRRGLGRFLLFGYCALCV